MEDQSPAPSLLLRWREIHGTSVAADMLSVLDAPVKWWERSHCSHGWPLACRLPLHPRRCGPTPDKCKSCFRFWSYAQPNYTNGMPDWPVYQGTDGRCRKVCARQGAGRACSRSSQHSSSGASIPLPPYLAAGRAVQGDC